MASYRELKYKDMARREVLNVTVCLMSLIGDNVFTVIV